MRSVTPWTSVAGIAILAGALSACGGNADRVAAPAADGGATGAAGVTQDLSVRYDAGDGTPPVTWTLDCATTPPTGSHPDVEGACSDLADAEDPFGEPDPDTACTEIYGGPQTARVTGTWQGDPVDTTFDRANGCGIARWDAVGRLLPAAPGEVTLSDPPAS